MKVNKAFTLIEILLVIVILGIILGLAAPQFMGGYSRIQLNETTDDLMSISRWAQAMAIGQERIYAISFSSDRRSYALIREKINKQTDSQDRFESIHGSLGKKRILPEAIHLEIQDDRIEFYPDGTIDPETIEIDSAQKKVTLSSSVERGMMIKLNDE